MATDAAQLFIPAEAVARLLVCDADSHLHDRAETCVEAIAAPVVAAELRRISEQVASDVRGYNDGATAELAEGSWDVIHRLRARADELDPAGCSDTKEA